MQVKHMDNPTARDYYTQGVKDGAKSVVDKINGFIGQGRLVVVDQQTQFYHSPIENSVIFENQVALELKDKERIEELNQDIQKLQVENKKLREDFETLLNYKPNERNTK